MVNRRAKGPHPAQQSMSMPGGAMRGPSSSSRHGTGSGIAMAIAMVLAKLGEFFPLDLLDQRMPSRVAEGDEQQGEMHEPNKCTKDDTGQL